MSTLTSLVISGKRKLVKKNVGRPEAEARDVSAPTESQRAAGDDGSGDRSVEAEARTGSLPGQKEVIQD
jgi:hypothetical protein